MHCLFVTAQVLRVFASGITVQGTLDIIDLLRERAYLVEHIGESIDKLTI